MSTPASASIRPDRLVVRTRRLPHDVDLAAHVPHRGGLAWIREGNGFVGLGEAARMDPGVGRGRFRVAAEWFAEVAAHARLEESEGGPVAFGSFTFDHRHAGSVVVVPRVLLGRRGDSSWVTTVTPAGEPPPPPPPRVRLDTGPRDRVRFAGSSSPDVNWLEAVAEVLRRIEAGSVDKVVLARDYAVWSRTPFEVPRLVRHLSDHFPGCFTFSCGGLVGASPELLARRSGDAVTSIVLAGSAGRDDDPDADDALGSALLASDKDRFEHDLAVSSVREVLATRCAELEVAEAPSLLRLENVQHLATRVDGRLEDDVDVLTLAGELHPTAAVGGVPRDAALDTIRELEGMDRDRYSGPVGWLDAAGDGEWALALRCAQLSGARARLFAGAGIVAGSLPEDELEETRLKLRAMQSAFAA